MAYPARNSPRRYWVAQFELIASANWFLSIKMEVYFVCVIQNAASPYRSLQLARSLMATGHKVPANRPSRQEQLTMNFIRCTTLEDKLSAK